MNASKRPSPAPARPWRWAILVVLVAQAAFLFSRTRQEEERAWDPLRMTNPGVHQPMIQDRGMLGTRAPAQPGDLVVSQGKALVAGLATDGKRVYFGESLLGQRILSVPVMGGAETLLGSGRMPLDVALGKDVLVVVDGGGLMVDGQGTITAFPLDGSGEPRVLASRIVNPTAMAISATHVYWLDGGNVDRDYVDGFVAGAPLAGGAHKVLAAGERQPNGLAVDATHVYWSRRDVYKQGEVVRMPIAGGPIEVVSPGQDWVKRITIVGTDVYWISAKDLAGTRAVVRKAPVKGGPALDVAVADTQMCGMAIDGDAVYWTDPGNVGGTNASTGGRILKQRLTGGEPIVLASGQDRPCYIAVDATHVYFSTRSLERVKRAPKDIASVP
ncbi:hypothetical protein [Polyangium mundeleinium]|uniref:Uncharacterized protein n=1 Tax=Polyangium mundeleinium TaxID=2995306 RepID=A0ABT5EWU9_9BACT|nr:hypothetical protein [Polyangium mundeleinium]MDC0746286.1 hypothetical protein [Polyangium mundeleinium]